MNYIKFLNPFVKLQKFTVLNELQTISTQKYSTLKAIQKCNNSYLQNNSTSLSEQIKKFTNFSVKQEKSKIFEYKKGEESILEKLNKTPLDNIKACVKINDVVVLIRKDLENSRIITFKLTKEYFKPVVIRIPLKSNFSKLKSKDVVMKNQEIKPPCLTNTAKYLNSLQDCCTQKKDGFPEYLPKKSSQIKNTEVCKTHKDDTSKTINHKQTILQKHTSTTQNPLTKGGNDVLVKNKDIDAKSHSCKSDLVTTDNKITEYSLNTKKYLNSLEECGTKASKNKETDLATTILQENKTNSSSSNKANIKDLDKTSCKKSNLVSALPKNQTKFVSKINDIQKLSQIPMASVVSNSSFYSRNAFKIIKRHGALFGPNITVSNLMTNKLKENHEHGKRIDENGHVKNLIAKKEQPFKESMTEGKCEHPKSTYENAIKDTKKISEQMIGAEKAADVELNSCKNVKKTLEQPFKESMTEEKCENPKSTNENSIKGTKKISKRMIGEEKAADLELNSCKNVKKTVLQNRHPKLQNSLSKPNSVLTSDLEPLCSKAKILKLSIKEFLSNSDHFNHQSDTKVFTECIKFANKLKQGQVEYNNKFPAPEMSTAELISNKIKSTTIPSTEKRRNVKKMENKKIIEEAKPSQGIYYKALQINSDIFVTQIGGQMPKFK